MSLRGCWGGEFGGAFFKELDGVRTGSSTFFSLMAVEAGSARTGSFGYRFTTDAGLISHTPSLRIGGNTYASDEGIALRFYMKVDALPTQRLGICNFTTAGQIVFLNPDGRLDIGTELTPTYPTTPAVIVPGTWHRIEIARATYSDGNLLALRLDGDLKESSCTGTGGTGGTGNDQTFIGWQDIHDAVPEAGLVMHVDDIAITSGTWPGDGHVERMAVSSMDFGDSWVPGAWRNVADTAPDDVTPGNPYDCYCGPRVLGVETDPVTDYSLIEGFNASPPVGFSASHALDPGTAGAYGRDYGMELMVSSPGRDKFLDFIDWVVGGCLNCGTGGAEGLGGMDEYQWAYPAHPMTADSSFTCNLSGASGAIRGAYWVLAAARGDFSPNPSTGGTGSHATVFIPGLESSSPRNLAFDTQLVAGGDWPTGWRTFMGPVHDRPGGVATVEMERDPGTSPIQVCVMTVVADVGAGDEPIPTCNPELMLVV